MQCDVNTNCFSYIVTEAATAAASVCGGITCWLSAVALAAIFSSVVIVLLLLVCLTVTGCVVRQRTKKPAALS